MIGGLMNGWMNEGMNYIAKITTWFWTKTCLGILGQ